MTAIQVQLRRGTEAENDAFTGAEGEIVYDTENKNIRTHDGATAGGEAQASQTWVTAQIDALSSGSAVNIVLAVGCI